MTDLREHLWNESVGPSDYTETGERYRDAVLEQYKLCVEMADRVSARRTNANTFFLTFNSLIVTFLSTALPGARRDLSVWTLLPALIILVSACAAWWMLVRSYRQLNRGKFAVIGALEERLPARAFYPAEWKELGEGQDWRVYLPLTHVERWIPLIFIAAYTLGFVALLL
ncbi:RipA family octameric membrane protein [Streptomyces bluensis]|uniref:Small integral membrane protein n=1 Tax=Streptomyces bluensis TaxID=33897 RepID=A0ABW6UDH6_9ACTN